MSGVSKSTDAKITLEALLFLLFRIVCGARVTHRAHASSREFCWPCSALRRSVVQIQKPSFRPLISANPALLFSFYSSTSGLVLSVGASAVVKDKILCFVCAVKNIERTFNTYYELQDHLYRDHDMKKDPAMEIFNKYKNTRTKTSTPSAQQ